MTDEAFWTALEGLVRETELVIDRPGGSRHPRYPEIVYPMDYGYLAGTTAMDGGGIDVWRGSLPGTGVAGVICTVDLLKRDAEIKILLGCTPDEVRTALAFHNAGSFMKGVLLPRPA